MTGFKLRPSGDCYRTDDADSLKILTLISRMENASSRLIRTILYCYQSQTINKAKGNPTAKRQAPSTLQGQASAAG